MTIPVRNRASTGARSAISAMLFAGATMFAVHPAAAALDTFLLDFTKFGRVVNTECGVLKGICGAVASINSYTFLINTWPQFYGNTPKPIDKGSYANQTDAAKAWASNGWTSPGGAQRQGFYPRPGTAGFDFWHTKIDWLEDWAPGRTEYSAQVFTTEDVSKWRMGTRVTSGYPTWDFLLQEVKDREDVELFIKRTTGTGYHVITLTGLEIDRADPTIRYIRYQDPNDPANEKRERLLFNSTDQRWEFDDQFTFGGNRVFIEAAFSESPIVPLPASAWLLLSGLLLLGWARRAERIALLAIAIR